MLYCHSVHFDYAVINYAVVIVGNNEAVKRAKDTKKGPDNRLSLMPCVKGFEPSTYWSVARWGIVAVSISAQVCICFVLLE